MKRFRGHLGSRIKFLITGGAPTSQVVIDFLRKCFQVPVSESYGTSEVGGIFTDNLVRHDTG